MKLPPKPTHGGKREGAGRKPGLPNTKLRKDKRSSEVRSVSYSLTEETLQALQEIIRIKGFKRKSFAVDWAIQEALKHARSDRPE